MKTGTITFNVRERGRQHRGQPRNFDTVALAALINGPAVQEQVAKGDMHGYFGHWPRLAFGMNPGEGGIVDGKVVRLEPALTTTKLTALPDGTIEHEAEFMDTAMGRTAEKMFSRKRGGFSSAIACREYAGRDVAIGFYGFDYVMEPNFSTNRGYALDGVQEESALMLDAAAHESQATIAVLDGLYSTLQADYDNVAQALARAQSEIAELVDMVARAGIENKAKRRLAALDSVATRPETVFARLDSAPMVRMAREFETMPLAGVVTTEDPADKSLAQQLGGLVHGFFDNFRTRL